jgi:predicted PurR-regulated permease PerM
MPTNPHSPSWSTTTKVFVAAFTLVVIGLAVWRFHTLIGPLIIAGIIAYLLNPIIVWLERYTHLSRGLAIAVVYPIFAVIVLAVLIAAGVTIYSQIIGLIVTIQEIFWTGPEQLNTLLSQPITFGPWTVDGSRIDLNMVEVMQQVLAVIQPALSQSALFVGYVASTTATLIGWTIVVFVLSIYFAIDLPRFAGLISQAIYQPGYRRDVEQLLHEFGSIWNGYLRGQSTLALIMVVIYSAMLWLLGVRFALALGLLAGVLDFVPYLGPTIILSLSTLVALFQGDNWLGFSPIWYAILVALAGLTIQQIEGNWLNPRIVGRAVGLHPLLVIIGAIMGSTLAGILGVILAAPIIATIKLLGTYGWRKMFDLEPFPEPELLPEPEPVLAETKPSSKEIQPGFEDLKISQLGNE